MNTGARGNGSPSPTPTSIPQTGFLRLRGQQDKAGPPNRIAPAALNELERAFLKESFRQARKLNSKITGEFNQNITGVRVVKGLGREDANLREFATLTGQMYKASYRAAWLSALFLPGSGGNHRLGKIFPDAGETIA